MDMDQLPRSPRSKPMQLPGRKYCQVEKSSGKRKYQNPPKSHHSLGLLPSGHDALMSRQVTVTSAAVVFAEDPPEKDLAPRWVKSERLEMTQGPVTAEAQDPWSWNQWLRQSGNSTAAPEWFPHPSPLALSGDLSYPKPHSWVWSSLKPRTFWVSLNSCMPLSMETQGRMVIICNPNPSKLSKLKTNV